MTAKLVWFSYVGVAIARFLKASRSRNNAGSMFVAGFCVLRQNKTIKQDILVYRLNRAIFKLLFFNPKSF